MCAEISPHRMHQKLQPVSCLQNDAASVSTESLERPLEVEGAERAGVHILLAMSRDKQYQEEENLFQPEATLSCTSKGHEVHTAVNEKLT